MTLAFGNRMILGVTCLLILVWVSPVQSQRFNKIIKIELSGGESSLHGNVMVTSDDGISRPLCDDKFGMAEANAVCVSLGFVRALTFTRGHHFGANLNRKWTPDGWKSMYYLECPNTNHSISAQSCNLRDNREDLCTLSEVAGVMCLGNDIQCNVRNEFACLEDLPRSSTPCIDESRICDGVPDCSEGSDETPELCNVEGIFRLESNLQTSLPDNTVAGTVFMKYNQTWSSICLRQFDEREAQVICRNLGYGDGDGISQAFFRAYLGEGRGDIRIDQSHCLGSETSLTQCPDFVWGESICGHFADAGVLCHDGTVDVQLVGGRADSGRLEITSSGFSETLAICDDGFDDQDARVVCRMLGYSVAEATTIKGSPFGSGSGVISNMVLDCFGNETSIQDCSFKLSNILCNHRNTAAVSCVRDRKSVEELLSLVLPADCGEPVDSSDRIITSLGLIRGGKIPSMFDVPWLANLRVRTLEGYQHICGAVVISENYLLTAAHCFRIFGKLQVAVTVGDFNDKHHEAFQQTFEIEEIFAHEEFGKVLPFENDIAIIKVKAINRRGIKLGDRVKPVCLPRIDSYEELDSCTVAGWGRVKFSESAGTTLPRVARTVNVMNILCERSQGSADVTSKKMCFINDLTNACKGDSGGPISCRGSQGRQVLHGIVSFGNPCNPLEQVLDVNTRVASYLRWIQETIYRDLGLKF